MQQYSTHRSNTPLVIAAVGIGALLAYVLSSPRRRTALVAAGQTAFDASSRFVNHSAERLREMLPEASPDSINRFAARTERTATGVAATAASKLHDAVDRAGELMHEVVARARRLPADAQREAREQARDWRDSADDAVDSGGHGRAAAGGLILAAAAVGAGLYALQRYGGSERLREKIGADDSGTITLSKSLFIEAPIEHVYDTWSNYENFPQFMSSVKSVQPLAGDRSHWTVRGPAGIGLQFDSIARMERPSEVAWESEPGSKVSNSGRVTLVPEGYGTRVNVQLSYRPPAGAMGQAVSSLLGADPKQQFEDDLERMRQFIESRRPNLPLSSMPAAGTERSNP
ncbi:MAG TPA: SRPBCC family protein [Burkholderiaceae bacterium]|nr:SRPBCC family protein [Burkholderiaceae bacterium]